MTALIIICVLLALSLAVMVAAYFRLKDSVRQGEMGMYVKLRDSEEDKTRLKRQLTQNIAHELKTPVSSIHGYLETIATSPDIDEETRSQFITRCYAQSQRLSALVSDILTLNKLDDAPDSYDFSDVNVLELLSTIRNDVAMQADKNQTSIRVLIDPSLQVHGNHSLLYSIFRNLTDNAIAYAGTGATFTIQTISEDDKSVTFSCSDNGPGVAQEHVPHLFERFYRVDKGRSRKMGGTGLGLAIVKNSVLLHGGTISAKIGQAGGLEFIFTLPKHQ